MNLSLLDLAAEAEARTSDSPRLASSSRANTASGYWDTRTVSHDVSQGEYYKVK